MLKIKLAHIFTYSNVVEYSNNNNMPYRKSGYFCCRLIFSDFAGQLDSQKYFS